MAEQILNNFLTNAPPGEFDACCADVKGLLGASAGSVFTQAQEAAAARAWDQDQMIAVTSGDHSVLLTKYNCLGDSYLDSKGKQTIVYNHLSKTVESSAPATVDEDLEPWRNALDLECSKYASGFFLNGVCGVYAQPNDPSGAFVVKVCISAALFKGAAFYNGRWRSDYTVTFTPGKAGDVVGVVKTNVHCFEGGNVQLDASVNKSKRGIPCLNAADFASNVAQTLNAMETDYQVQFEAVYDGLDASSFKALRRALPMKRELLRWPQIMSYKLNDDLSSKGRR
jgi:capping protein (actin filament) muscle Z-line, alpha